MEAATEIFRSLGDPTRRGLFETLMQHGEMTVGQLAEQAPVSQPAVSQHLAVLRSAGLVAERRSGRNIHYRAEAKALKPLVDWVGVYATFWTDRFQKLANLLEEMD